MELNRNKINQDYACANDLNALTVIDYGIGFVADKSFDQIVTVDKDTFKNLNNLTEINLDNQAIQITKLLI